MGGYFDFNNKNMVLTYYFFKEIYVKGYMIQTANDDYGRDPVSWFI